MSKQKPRRRHATRALLQKGGAVLVSLTLATGMTPVAAFAATGEAVAANQPLVAQSVDLGAPSEVTAQYAIDSDDVQDIYLNDTSLVDIDAGEAAYFRFTAPYGGWFEFYSYKSEDSFGDPYGELFDSVEDVEDGESSYSNDDGAGDLCFSIKRYLSEYDQVILRASELDGEAASYYVTVVGYDPEEPEPSDPDDSDDPYYPTPSSDFDTPIQVGRTITVPGHYYSSATFQFKAPETGLYTFSSKGASAALSAYIYEGDARTYADVAADGNFSITYAVAAGDKVSLYVNGRNDDDPYTVTVAAAAEKITALTAGTAAAAATGTAAKYYSFKAPKAGSYKFTSTGTDVTASLGRKASCATNNYSSSFTLSSENGRTRSLKKDETVYLKTTGSTADASYAVKVDDVTKSIAPLTLDQASDAVTTDDEALFSFTASEEGLYQLTLDGTVYTSLSAYTDASFEDSKSYQWSSSNSEGNVRSSAYTIGLAKDESVVFATSANSSYSSEVVSYTAKVSKVAPTQLTAGTAVNGTGPASGAMYYSFTASKDLGYSFDFSNLAYADATITGLPYLYVSLYSDPQFSDYVPVRSSDDAEAKTRTFQTYGNLEANKTYYLRVSGDQGASFKLEVTPFESFDISNWDADLGGAAYSYYDDDYYYYDTPRYYVYDAAPALSPRVYRSGVYLKEGTDFQIDTYLDSEGKTLGGAPNVAGNYKVRLKGIGKYTGTKVCDFRVLNAYSLDSYYLTMKSEELYAFGAPVEPELTVWRYDYADGIEREVRLQEGTDYTVSYQQRSDNETTDGTSVEQYKYIDVAATALDKTGTYLAIVTGLGKYASADVKKQEEFIVVNANDLSDQNWRFDVQVEDTAFEKGSSAKEPTVQVTQERQDGTELTLKQGTSAADGDYTVSFQKQGSEGLVPMTADDWKAQGRYYAVITGVGKYTGSIVQTFYIRKQVGENTAKWLEGIDLKETAYETTGEAVKPLFVVYTYENGLKKALAEGTDYAVTFIDDDTDEEVAAADLTEPGRYRIAAEGLNDYLGRVSSGSYFTIEATNNDITSMRVRLLTLSSMYAYTGEAIALPEVLVAKSNNDGTDHYTELKAGTDYDYQWVNANDEALADVNKAVSQTEVGVYTVKITGKGNYTGTVRLTARIVYSDDLSQWDGFATDSEYLATYGQAVEPEFTLVLGNTEPLVQGTDFKVAKYLDVYNREVAAADLKEAGTYYALLEPIDTNAYRNTKMVSFEIQDGLDIGSRVYSAHIDGATHYIVGGELDFEYIVERDEKSLNGRPIKLVEGTHYDVVYTNADGATVSAADVTKAAGTYYAKAVGKAPYTGETDYRTISVSEPSENDQVIRRDWISLGNAHLDYFGTVQEPEVKVYDEDAECYLTVGKDYALSYVDEYQNPVAATDLTPEPGTYYVKVVGQGAYASTTPVFSRAFRVLDRTDIEGGRWVCELEPGSALHTGSAIEQAVNLYYDSTDDDSFGFSLTSGTDFDVSYEQYNTLAGYYEPIEGAPTEVGMYRAVVQAKGKYTGTVKEPFEILPEDKVSTDISNWDIHLNSYTLLIFDDKTVKPEVEASYYGFDATLTAGTDYTVSYVNEYGDTVTDVSTPGDYYAVVEGTGAYKGKRVLSFTVQNGYNFDNAYVDGDVTVWSFGSAVTPEFTVSLAGNNGLTLALEQDTDFEVTQYVDDHNNVIAPNALKDAGRYTATLVGKGKYANTGEKTCTVTVRDAYDLTEWNVRVVNDTILADGSAVEPIIEISRYSADDGTQVYLKEGTDFKVSGYQDGMFKQLSGAPTEVGVYWVTIEGMGQYKGTAHEQFSLTDGTDIGDWYVGDDVYSCLYLGQPITPSVTLYLYNAAGEQVYLTQGTDFEVASYTDAKGVTTSTVSAPGSYQLEINGLGSHTGTRTVTCTVTDGTDLSKWIVSITNGSAIVAHDYSGTLSKPQVDVSMVTAKGNYVHLTEGTDFTVSYEDHVHNAFNGTYFNPSPEWYYAKVEGKGAFTGTVYRSFVAKKDDAAVAALVTVAIAQADSSKPATVAAARAAFDKLTADQKGFVPLSSVNKLVADEAAVAKAAAGKPGSTAAGQKFSEAGNSYTVASGTNVTFTAAKNAKSVSVPATIKHNGKTYKVTKVAAGAFKGAKIRTVTIGANVTKIAANAFKGSKATKLNVKTTKLKKAGVKNSLKGSKIKTVKVPKAKKAAYKKIFTKKVAGKKVKVK